MYSLSHVLAAILKKQTFIDLQAVRASLCLTDLLLALKRLSNYNYNTRGAYNHCQR